MNAEILQSPPTDLDEPPRKIEFECLPWQPNKKIIDYQNSHSLSRKTLITFSHNKIISCPPLQKALQ